jgi:hypothetical protein
MTCPKCGSSDIEHREWEEEGYWGEEAECLDCGWLEEHPPSETKRRDEEREAEHVWRMNERALARMDRILGPGWDET